MKKSNYIKMMLVPIWIWLIGCTQESLQDLSLSEQVQFNIRCKDISIKSVLGNRAENQITDLCLWAYDEEGILETQQYYNGEDVQHPSLFLSGECAHHIYALINMGQISAPETQRKADQFTYRLPSYREIAKKGLPMSGKLENLAANSPSGTLFVNRLFAKISLTMTQGEISPDEISQITVCNCNMSTQPFSIDGSRAQTPEDVNSHEEGEMTIHSGWENNRFVFYVPENRQGILLPENQDQNQKTPAMLTSHQKKKYIPLCTYIEATVFLKDEKKHHGITGQMKYRFYLGGDNTSDFDIIRNQDYHIDWSLTWNGQFYQDNWRVDNSRITDRRELEIEGVLGYTTTMDGYLIQRGNNVQINPGCTGGISIRYSIGGLPLQEAHPGSSYGSTYDSESNLFTMQHYDKPEGWILSQETKDLLRAHGITWTLQQAVLDQDYMQEHDLHLDRGKTISFVTKAPSFYDSNIEDEHYRFYLLLTLPQEIEKNKVIPLLFQMKDGSAYKKMNLYTSTENITYQLSVENPITGTCPTLTVNTHDPYIKRIHLSVAEESKSQLTLQPIGSNQYKLFLKNHGEAMINVEAETLDGKVTYPKFQFNITHPELRISPEHFILELDGEASPYKISYFPSYHSRQEIPIAESDEAADGNSFAPSLYQDILNPITQILDGITTDYQGQTITCSQDHLCLEEKNGYGKLWLDQSHRPGETLSLMKVSAPSTSIRPLYVPISTDNFLNEFNGTEDYGNFLFTFSSQLSAPTALGWNLPWGNSTVIDSKKLVYNKKKYRIEIESRASHLETRLNNHDQIEIIFSGKNKKLTEGRIDLTAHVYSLNKGELILTRPLGFLSSYIYTCSGPFVQKNSSGNLDVSVEISNISANDTFKKLFEKIKQYKGIVRPNLKGSEGWVSIDHEPNCFSFPKIDHSGTRRIPNRKNDNYYLNKWKILKQSGSFGETIYQVIPGNGFLHDFDNCKRYCNTYSPYLTINLDNVPDLQFYPSCPGFYFIKTNDPNKLDQNGNSYLLIYSNLGTGWINE